MKIPALFTDLYELTMAQAYAAEGMDQPAVFELIFRRTPKTRNYVVAAGIGDVVEFLEDFRFGREELGYLAGFRQFSDAFLKRLERVRFTGEVWAIPEGTVVFPNEPIVQVVAPVLEAQLMETLVLNQIHFQSLAAAKAARVVEASQGRSVVDFGSRRAHGTDAALKVARAVYLAGGAGTSNVLAGMTYGIPVFGTMAHSYVQAHDSESVSFEAFAALYPDTTLLVDTYDTLAGVQKVIELSRKLGDRFQVRGVRLDSGDLGSLAKQARTMLNAAGLKHVTIFATSGLDEYEIQELVSSGAPIDAFGVGTKLAVLEDAPHLDMAYKLVEYAGKGRLKLSPGKALYPGRKQIFRQSEGETITGDVIGRFEEKLPGEPLLKPFMRDGRRTARIDLEESRRRFQRELQRLPSRLRKLEPSPDPFPVTFSVRLREDLEKILRTLSLDANQRL